MKRFLATFLFVAVAATTLRIAYDHFAGPAK